jgi:hypothetical protein
MIELLYAEVNDVSPSSMSELLYQVNSEIGKTDIGVSETCDIGCIDRLNPKVTGHQTD